MSLLRSSFKNSSCDMVHLRPYINRCQPPNNLLIIQITRSIANFKVGKEGKSGRKFSCAQLQIEKFMKSLSREWRHWNKWNKFPIFSSPKCHRSESVVFCAFSCCWKQMGAHYPRKKPPDRPGTPCLQMYWDLGCICYQEPPDWIEIITCVAAMGNRTIRMLIWTRYIWPMMYLNSVHCVNDAAFWRNGHKNTQRGICLVKWKTFWWGFW